MAKSSGGIDIVGWITANWQIIVVFIIAAIILKKLVFPRKSAMEKIMAMKMKQAEMKSRMGSRRLEMERPRGRQRSRSPRRRSPRRSPRRY